MFNRSKFFLLRTLLLFGFVILLLRSIDLWEPARDETINLPSSRLSPASSSSPSSVIVKPNVSRNYTTSVSFRQELIDERLRTYASMYDEKEVKCTADRPFQAEEKENYDTIEKMLTKIRSETIPYPENDFTGRGIVLTMGAPQLPFIKVNLQMIAYTSTRLPVQVSIDLFCQEAQSTSSSARSGIHRLKYRETSAQNCSTWRQR